MPLSKLNSQNTSAFDARRHSQVHTGPEHLIHTLPLGKLKSQTRRRHSQVPIGLEHLVRTLPLGKLKSQNALQIHKSTQAWTSRTQIALEQIKIFKRAAAITSLHRLGHLVRKLPLGKSKSQVRRLNSYNHEQKIRLPTKIRQIVLHSRQSDLCELL